ncbi:hypothetical protein D3C83_144250 [compost metagenome]
MIVKEKSGFAVMQYVNDGKVLVSFETNFDSGAVDNAATASDFVGSLAPHATVTAASVKRTKCRRVICKP